MEDMCNEAIKEEMKEVAVRLLKEGSLTIEKIAECCQLTVNEVKMLSEQK